MYECSGIIFLTLLHIRIMVRVIKTIIMTKCIIIKKLLLMNKFEQLLLKTGSPELIDAYLKEYQENVDDDFRKAVVVYGEKVNKLFSTAAPASDELLNWDIATFLDNYCSGNVVRIYNTLSYHGVKTVRDIVKCHKGDLEQTRNFGSKSMANLCLALAKVDLQLCD